MTDASRADRGARRPSTRRSVWLWLVPSVLVAVLALLALERRASPSRHSAPTVASPDESIPGFGARVEWNGATLRIRLSPLHPDVEHERFDALALRRRLARADGEPWRATLALDSDPARSTDARLELGALRVVDDGGEALTTLPPPELRADEAADPLRTLFAAPTGSLTPGSSIEIVMWGREPHGTARLEGLAGESIALAPSSFRRADLELPIARLELAGKKTLEGSSAPDASTATSR